MQLTPENASSHADAFLATCGEYPGGFDGPGIVTCGGGIKYGGCAWVLVNLLRHLGCRLPIEVWCLNDDEYDPQWVELLRPLNVRCVNAAEVLKRHPHRRLGGWELKPYAIQHSSFREVLFLDSDNVPVRDPSFLLESKEFAETGTLFWPDPEVARTRADNPLWKIFGVDYRDGPDQESGQLVIDKSRCWKALLLCNWYNEHSDFYYQHVYGDKETFRLAWQRLEQPIHWPDEFATGHLLFCLQQYDFAGEVLFQHRFYHKWSLFGENIEIPHFQHESICLSFLDELRQSWQPQRHLMRRIGSPDRSLMGKVLGQRFLYSRLGHNRWSMRLGPEGRIEEGFGENEHFWWCEQDCLIFVGVDGQQKCRLRQIDDNHWLGESLGARRVRVRLKLLMDE